MPTTYTHDLFGKLIYKKLPDEMRKIIRKNGNLYRIGLHGPDILFYHLFDSKVNQLGVQMHKERARVFFEKGMKTAREKKDEALVAYLIGFGCHYLLDTCCHPYVNAVDEKGTVSHTLLEKEFDRTLMIRTKKNPYYYYPSDCIIPKPEYAREINKAITDVPPRKIYMSLRLMKLFTNAMVYDNGGRRRKAVGMLVWLAGKKTADQVMDHFMTKEQSEESAEAVLTLSKLFLECVEQSPVYLEELFSLYKENRSLSDRWNMTYSG